jgi:hypothetical protein
MDKKKGQPTPSDPKEMAACALNEQGFLFAQIIREEICGNKLSKDPNVRHTWKVLAQEYPVTAGDGSQTKIDLVLKKSNEERFLCLECKRPNPKYKRWLFWDKADAIHRQDTANTFFVDAFHFREQKGSEYKFTQGIERLRTAHNCPVFNYYVEAIENKDRQDRYSSTEALEKALLQVIRGNTGLMRKFRRFNKTLSYRSIPVVVTTAEILALDFQQEKVSRETGMIEPADLDVRPLDYCAVLYRADDNLSVPVDEYTVAPSDITVDLFSFQVRTVFVVQATAVTEFLCWLGELF